MADEDQRHAHRHRVRAFVEFWNYTLTMQAEHQTFRTTALSLDQFWHVQR